MSQHQLDDSNVDAVGKQPAGAFVPQVVPAQIDSLKLFAIPFHAFLSGPRLAEREEADCIAVVTPDAVGPWRAADPSEDPKVLVQRLDAAAAGVLARDIVLAGADYGHTDTLTGERINLEFVSANPTGPIHIGGVRWAAVGDSLARIFQAEGAEVTREYYFNDHGAQIDRFVRSLVAAAKGEPAPEDGYAGTYVSDEAEVTYLDSDAEDSKEESHKGYYLSAEVDGLLVKDNRAVVSGRRGTWACRTFGRSSWRLSSISKMPACRS